MWNSPLSKACLFDGYSVHGPGICDRPVKSAIVLSHPKRAAGNFPCLRAVETFFVHLSWIPHIPLGRWKLNNTSAAASGAQSHDYTTPPQECGIRAQQKFQTCTGHERHHTCLAVSTALPQRCVLAESQQAYNTIILPLPANPTFSPN